MSFLKKYPAFLLSEDEVRFKISSLLSDVSKYETPENYKSIFSLIDLTSLNSFDTSKTIDCFIDQLNSFAKHYPNNQNVAAICVYPPFINQIKSSLNPQTQVKIACVAASFPSSQTYLEVKKKECELILLDGADELDIVISLRLFLEKNYQKVIDEIKNIKLICGQKHLKVILETGVLKIPKLIYEASLLAMEAGADFIKTSTGKLDPAATLEAVYAMCQAIVEFNKINDRKIGIKAAGGISNTEEAIKYYVLVKKMLGDDYLNSGLFRIGASKLANNILSKVEGITVSYFGERVLKNEALEKNKNSKEIEIETKNKEVRPSKQIKKSIGKMKNEKNSKGAKVKVNEKSDGKMNSEKKQKGKTFDRKILRDHSKKNENKKKK